jgi:hypothetical protein
MILIALASRTGPCELVPLIDVQTWLRLAGYYCSLGVTQCRLRASS